MLRSSAIPTFGELNLDFGGLAHADMNMMSIEKSIEKMLDKKTEAYGKKGCETVDKYWKEAYKTIRECEVQRHITMRQNSANKTKQNLIIVNSKKEVALKVKK